MNTITALLGVSAFGGLVLGFYFSWRTILVSGLIVAIVAATVLQWEGFGALAGIAIIVACLTVNQISYLTGVTLVTRGSLLIEPRLVDHLPHPALGQELTPGNHPPA
jgi:hypothetical protein